MKDAIITAALVLGLATLITVHVALAVKLARRGPFWRGPVAFVVPPLAVVWGFQAGFRRLATVWLCAVAVYAAALTWALALS